MFDQLTELVNQFGSDTVVNNNAVPNEQNKAVLQETNSSILDGLKSMASGGNLSELASLFQGNSIDKSNPVVQKLTDKLSGNLGQKLGLSSETATSIAATMIPKILGSLIGNAKDPNKKGFEISDIISAITNGKGNEGLMDAISNYGTQFGLDQNGDGKVGMDDAIAAVTKQSGGIGGMLGKMFGK